MLTWLVAFFLSCNAYAGFGSNTGFGTDVQYQIEHGTYTIYGSWTFAGDVVVSTQVVQSTVATQSPILGDGSNADPIRLDTTINGVTDFGAKTSAEIRNLACPLRPCRVISTDDSDTYISTGTLVGQWRNQRLGVGP